MTFERLFPMIECHSGISSRYGCSFS